jgi:hypothetical protein
MIWTQKFLTQVQSEIIMIDRLDLEQQIMQCWNIVDDLDYLGKLLETDDAQNLLIGLKALYQAKFEKLFDTFERYISK